MTETISIALDGPSGVGKSTIAKRIAEKLNFVYIDTGAMFRGLAVYFLDRNLDPEDQKECEAAVSDADVTITYQEDGQHVMVNGTDVTSRLRFEEVSRAASVTSQYPAVRTHLLELQRKLAATSNVIMDGRDIGTVVLPNATLKIFLTADPHIRAIRRYRQLKEQGKLGNASLEEIEADINERDYRDTHRETAPLRQAEDAVYLDSGNMTITEVEDRILEELKACR